MVMGEGDWRRRELMEKLGLQGRDNFEKLYLMPALAGGFIEMTIPDKPRSRLQKYRQTEAGRRVLEQKQSSTAMNAERGE
jgi:ATP-dependent DNA helicase RecG